jgi:UDP-N-acetylglucosamine--N-acetylmuramyl-(pentapeptide) pyrophosphoryl-undecaprenol N-acetylglucosamine transferase
LIAAIFLNKKYCLCEQNYIPGRLNKKFSKSARYIFTSFEETGKYFNVSSEKIIFSGNPVRESIKDFKKGRPNYEKWGLDSGRFTIVAFGGSLGAEKINDAVIKLWDHFRHDEKIQVLLISGQRFYNNINNKISGISKHDDLSFIKILPYINEMEEIYRIADLIISRSGANTIAELLVTNIPAILIPYPEAIENHQFFNANYIARNRKAILMPDKDLEKNLLSKTVEDLLSNNREKYNAMREEKFEFEKINGEKIIGDAILGVIN